MYKRASSPHACAERLIAFGRCVNCQGFTEEQDFLTHMHQRLTGKYEILAMASRVIFKDIFDFSNF